MVKGVFYPYSPAIIEQHFENMRENKTILSIRLLIKLLVVKY